MKVKSFFADNKNPLLIQTRMTQIENRLFIIEKPVLITNPMIIGETHKFSNVKYIIMHQNCIIFI